MSGAKKVIVAVTLDTRSETNNHQVRSAKRRRVTRTGRATARTQAPQETVATVDYGSPF